MMKRNKFLEFAGFAYIANHGTREIHRVSSLTSRCRVILIRRGGYCTAWKATKLLKKGYNGCRYCNKKEDKG
jgi:hypothetical protein